MIRRLWRDTLIFLAFYGALWFLLTGGKGWLFGSVIVLLSTALSLHLGFSLRIFNPVHLPRFILFYLRELLIAGWQVARTACHPAMAVQPGWVSLTLKCRSAPAQLMLATFVCLLPGTLTSRVTDGHMEIHLLDTTQPWRSTVEKLESHLMALLRENQQ